jgi:hypothetical protein
MALLKNMASSNSIGRTKSVSFDMFFDRQKMTSVAENVERKALNRAGATVRTIARHSMKSRKLGTASPPGKPPHRHKHSGKGMKSGTDYGLYKSVVYGYDRRSHSVVIGPSSTWGPRVHKLMETHEFGGRETKKNKRRRVRRIGGGGEIRVIGKGALGRGPGGRFRSVRGNTAKKMTDTLLGTVHVVYGKLYTEQQVRRANEINEKLYGPMVIHGSYPPRPTMGPALWQVAPKLPGMIRDEWAK